MRKCFLCEEMKELWQEQQLLAEFGKGFRFIHLTAKDTIPFMLQSTNHSDPFTAILDGIATPYFRVERINEDSCIALLSLLQPVDLKGQPALTDHELYTLKKTSQSILVNLCSFCAITPLSHELVDRPLPFIVSKA
ncbi:CotY/CotZ family spore coat protein [Sporosarcina luteola]|uniref:CotY/CotZ family spore coat protein n=1 Tax=Sporosarcina luteola TaxID=582850 RepID=UPI00204001F4|nr:CotY/CotZ family spore coat protein [Sporosarcina luteola]MCM3709698.1 CotY/CotZ family spore coat protein [Sporosarcina luteola]